MEESFFIGRDKELERLEGYALSTTPSLPNPGIAHICGPFGIGKTAFLNKFLSLLPDEPISLIWFRPEIENNQISTKEFYAALADSIECNLGDIQPQIEELRVKRNIGEDHSHEFFWSKEISHLINNAQNGEYTTIDQINLLFAIDDFVTLPSETRNSFCIFINRLAEDLKDSVRINVTLTAEEALINTPSIFGYWENALKQAIQIDLASLTREETNRLLDAHDIDQNLSAKIFADSNGIPAKIIEALNDQGLQSINSEEWYNRGNNLLLSFNHFQRKWMKWAAVLKVCNEEILSFIASEQEQTEALMWIHANYPNYFSRDKNDYSLLPDNRRAIIAYLKKEDPVLLKEITTVVQKFIAVNHTIPNKRHRKLLSLLSEFQYFDIDLIKKIFSREDADQMQALIESKPVFFREENLNYRLASNIRSSMTIYNDLLDLKNRTNLRTKIASLWKEKQKSLNGTLISLEKKLHGNEKRNRGLTISIGKMDDEISRLNRSKTKPIQTKTVLQSKVNSTRKVVTGVLLQILGIIILYVDILMLKHLSITYLLLSATCIVSGIVYSLRSGSTQLVTVDAAMNDNKRQQLEGIIKNLEIDRMSLMSQKDEIRVQIENDKIEILKIQSKLNQPYQSHLK